MEQEERKLTPVGASRYDRGRPMPEATATEELRGNIRQDVYESWKDDLINAKDALERATIMLAMEAGISKGQKDIKEMSKEELAKKLEEIENNEKRRNRTEFEKEIDQFIESAETNPENKKLPVPGEVLRKKGDILEKKNSWVDFGWSEQDVEAVDGRLRTVFRGPDALDENQRKIILEMLVATGQTPAQILEKLNPVDLENKTERERQDEMIRLFSLDLGIRQDYVAKFILPEEFRAYNKEQYEAGDADNIEELAWQIMHSYGHHRWGPKGEYPLLEMRIVTKKDDRGNDVIDPVKSRYYINEANMVLWVRERMHAAIDLNPDDPQKFFESINLVKRFSPWSLINVFFNPRKYTVSEGTVTGKDGKEKELKYGDLETQWIKEAWAMTTIRSWDVAYRGAMNDPDELLKTMKAIFMENTLLKQSFKKNLFNLMTTLSLNFEGKREDMLPRSDNLLGAAWIDIFMAYYNLSDFESLQKVFGKGSSFFTREGFMSAFKGNTKDKIETTGERHPTTLDRDSLEILEKAFDPNGFVATKKNEENFIKLVNFQRMKLTNSDIELAVRQMFKNAVAEKYGSAVNKKGEVVDKDSPEFEKYALVSGEGREDTWSLYLAENIAWSLSRVFGAAARNDTTAAGYDFFTKMLYGETYRVKQTKNGVAGGNPNTMRQFKMFVMDALNAITTTSYIEYDVDGDKIKEIQPRQKTTLEVMWELQQLSSARNLQLKQLEDECRALPEGEEKTQKMQDLEDLKRKRDESYQDKAGELVFKQKALQNYYEDHYMRAFKVYNEILGAEEFDFEKFVRYDAYGGVRFDREDFQKQVQAGFLHHIRYFLNTYPDLNYNATIRALDQTATIRNANKKPPEGPVFRDMPMGEAMFGHELLNRPEFWKRDKNGKPINMVYADGTPAKGVYEIDYDKVNTPAGKELLVKQWYMTKIAADLWSHRAFHSTDPRFDINYYTNVIAAIGGVVSEFEADEYSITQQRIKKRFLDKKDMKWFKRTAKVENFNLYSRAVLKDLVASEEKDETIFSLGALGLSTFVAEVIRQRPK